MKGVMRWIKMMPITAGSIVVMLIAICFTFLMLSGWVAQYKENTKKWAESQSNEINGIVNTTVEILAENPEDPPITHTGPVVPSIVEFVGIKNEEVRAKSESVARVLEDRNRYGHEKLLPDTNLFPEFEASVSTQPFDVFTAYHNKLAALTDKPTPEQLASGVFPARLDAGEPLANEELDPILENIEKEYYDPLEGLNNRGGQGNQLSSKELEEMQEKQRKAVMNRLGDHAKSVHIYAYAASANELSSKQIQDFPFTVIEASSPPTIDQAWEAQMNLWIQEDLVRAIAYANTLVTDPDTGEVTSDYTNSNVITAPVKRLLAIRQTDTGYVGYQAGTGSLARAMAPKVEGVRSRKAARRPSRGGGAAAAAPGFGFDPAMMFGGGEFGMMGGPEFDMGGGGNTRTKPGADPELPKDPDEKMEPRFTYGVTGRYSNPLYDVKHVELVVIADIRKMDLLFDAISKVNLMTVTDVTLEDVNEYDELLDGFYYGQGDMVRATLKIETVWLRSWTEPMMPESYKTGLEIGVEEGDGTDESMNE